MPAPKYWLVQFDTEGLGIAVYRSRGTKMYGCASSTGWQHPFIYRGKLPIKLALRGAVVVQTITAAQYKMLHSPWS